MKLVRKTQPYGAAAVGFVIGSLFITAAWAGSVTYQYDLTGWLLTTTYTDGSKAKYTFDAAGNRKIVQSGPPGTVALSPAAPSVDTGSASGVLLAQETRSRRAVTKTSKSVLPARDPSTEPLVQVARARFYQPPPDAVPEMSEARAVANTKATDSVPPATTVLATAQHSESTQPTSLDSEASKLTSVNTQGTQASLALLNQDPDTGSR